MRVDAYWNLHKGMWSLRERKTRRVALRTPYAVLQHVTFVVSEPGRQRVIKDKRKNVHAFARGHYFSSGGETASRYLRYAKKFGVRVTYNPYLAGHFFDVATGDPIKAASWVVLFTNPEDGKPEVWAMPTTK